jgi:hypothetical protein
MLLGHVRSQCCGRGTKCVAFYGDRIMNTKSNLSPTLPCAVNDSFPFIDEGSALVFSAWALASLHGLTICSPIERLF